MRRAIGKYSKYIKAKINFKSLKIIHVKTKKKHPSSITQVFQINKTKR